MQFLQVPLLFCTLPTWSYFAETSATQSACALLVRTCVRINDSVVYLCLDVVYFVEILEIYVSIYICVCVCVYIYIYAYIYIYICVCVCLYLSLSRSRLFRMLRSSCFDKE